MNGLRAALLAAGVLVGAIIIANGFPNTSPSAAPSPSASGSPSPHARPTATPTPPAQKLTCASPKGIQIAVENAADPSITLASPAADTLKTAGYTIQPTDVSDA